MACVVLGFPVYATNNESYCTGRATLVASKVCMRKRLKDMRFCRRSRVVLAPIDVLKDRECRAQPNTS